MIQEAQAKQLLEETFARMNPGEAMEPGRKKYAELRVRRAERRVSCTGNLYQKAREALTEQETLGHFGSQTAAVHRQRAGAAEPGRGGIGV